MRPLSQDLRQRIIAAREDGAGTGEVCQRFGVSRKSVERFWKEYCRAGQCLPKQIGGYRRSRWPPMIGGCNAGLKPNRICRWGNYNNAV